MSLLGIDIGTSGCKAGVFSEDGECLAQAYREYPTLHPREGWAELDSRAVWRHVTEIIAETAAASRKDPITAMSVSSLGEAMVPVTRDRDILGNSILWSDSRGGEVVNRILKVMSRESFYEINANILGPNYSLPKLLWLKEHEADMCDRADYFLLWGDMAGFMLAGRPATSHSLASRTLLFDIRKEDWSDELLGLSGIERRRLGAPTPSGTIIGTVSAAAAAELGLPETVQVVAGGHDQCCNALGAGVIRAGQAVCGIGSFECITPAFDHIPDAGTMLANGLNIEHHVLPGLFVSFLYNQGGTLVKWFRDTFAAGEGQAAGGGDIYGRLQREMPAGPTRLITLPYFEPTGPPHFLADAAGVIAGLKTATTRGEILKSILECETFYFVDGIDVLRSLGIDASLFIATGGGARSDQWLQIKADIFGVPFARPRITEGSVLGAAMLAGLGTGAFATAEEAVERFVRVERVFEPDRERHEKYRERIDKYREFAVLLRGFF